MRSRRHDRLLSNASGRPHISDGATRLRQRDAVGGFRVAVVVALAVLLADGCASVQFLDQAGRPRLIGLGWTTPIGKTGRDVYRISAPGLSIRAYPSATGVSLGFVRMILFLPDDAGNTVRLVALQQELYGLDLGVGRFALGFDREFAVLLPSEEDNVVQRIDYSEADPGSAQVIRKETP
jgi:hypothetical protein